MANPRWSDRLVGWHAHAARIMGTLHAPDLMRVLDDAIGALAAFDLSVVFAYPANRPPIYLYDGFRKGFVDRSMDAYLRGAYLLDSVYVACMNNIAPGVYRLSELAPDDFFTGDYYNSGLVHPCISMDRGSLAEEVVFIANLEAGFKAAYSIMRSYGHEPFGVEEMAALRTVAPVICQAVAQHWRGLRASPGSGSSIAWSARGEEMELAFETFGEGVLTRREQEIVRLTLRGHSALSASAMLGLSEGTVKNHRKHIYAKLRVGTQSELFQRFIEHLLGPAVTTVRAE